MFTKNNITTKKFFRYLLSIIPNLKFTLHKSLAVSLAMPEAKKKAGIQRPAKRHAKRRAFIVPLRPAKHTKVKKEINRTPQKALEVKAFSVPGLA